MSGESKMHFYVNWAKERLDEMDAALASLEAKVPQVKADSKVKAEQAIADLKRRRDEFASLAKKEAEAGEATWQRLQTELESQWNSFEGQLKTYLETAGCKIADNSDPLKGDFRIQFRPLLTCCVSVLPFGPAGPGRALGNDWRGEDWRDSTRLF